MERFESWLNVTETHKLVFEAENLEEATKLIKRLNDGKLNVTEFCELTNGEMVCKAFDIESDKPEQV